MKKIICMKRIMSLAALVSMAVSCFGAVEAAAEGPEIVKKYYVNTAFEPTAEAPDGSWDGWTVRDDAGYPASNAGFAKGAASISGSGDNTYAAFQQTAGNGWMITKTLDAPMTGKVIFEADVNTGTVTHKTNRSLFTISQKGATGQIPLLLTSYGYFRSPKVSSAQDQVLLYPLDTENKWVHVKIELDFATGDIAYYFNGGEKATVSGDGKNTPVPASIAGDTFKTSYAYDAIKMYGGSGAELTTGLDNIQIYYEDQKQPEPEPDPEETVKKYYVNTAFEPTAEAPDGSWDGWTVRDDAGYPASNAGFAKGAASISGSGDNTYAAFQQTAGNGWMITKTLDAPMTGKVIFEADVNTGTVTHKTNRSLFTISQKGATGQIPLLLTSYGYFRSPKVSSAQDQVLLYPLDTENKWVHVKIELDFATGDIAYYFNGGEKATVSGDGKNTPVPASIAGDTFKTSYAYDTIKMYGGGGAALTTGLDNIQIFYEEQKQPEPEPETGRTYYIDTAFAGDGDAAWDVWSRRDNADYPAANGTIREEQGDPYASFASDGSGGWFISADSPRVFTGEVTFETRVRYSGMGAEPGYNRNLFVISDNDDGQVALINNSKSGFFKTAMSIGGSGTTASQLMKRVTENTWHTLKATVNFDTGAVQYSVDGALITEDGNSGAPIKTMLKEHAGNFDVSKPYHTIKLYMAKGETAVTDVDYIKVYKEERLCEGSAYLVTADELGEHRRRIYHLAPGELQGVATLANTEKTPIQPVVLMGLYKNGCLVAADSARTEEPIQPGAVQEVVCGLKLDLAEGESIAPYEVKMFVWRDTESLEPLGRIPLHLTPDCADEGVN